MGPEFRTPARTHVDVHHVEILVNAINLGYLEPPLLPLHFLYGRITERTPLLLQVDTWHRRQMIRISPTLPAQLGVVGGVKQIPQRLTKARPSSSQSETPLM